MKISRAIAVQSLAVCAGLILVAVVTIYSWGRYEQAQADAGLNARALQDFRLLERATKSWLLNNDLVFASNQTLLINNTRRQGKLIIDEAEGLSQTSLGKQAEIALIGMAELVRVNNEELLKLKYVTAEQPSTQDPLDAWDQRAGSMTEKLEMAREQLEGAATQRGASLVGERNNLIKLCVITYLVFGFLVIALWRWLSHSLARPLSDLTELAEHAFTNQESLELQVAGPTEVRKLTHSINAFIQGREKMAFERASELESEVRKRVAAEQVAQEAAEQAHAASKAKSQFLANMSHEIRTPLNGIIGSAELLMQDNSPAKTDWGLNNIQKSSHHLLSLVNEVLDFSKIEAGELELDPHEFLLKDLLLELRSIFTAKAREKGLVFVFEIAPDVPLRIEADSLRIRQVLTNLLSNAFNYTERGHVVLRCAFREGQHGRPAVLAWEVKDSGIGIPPEKQSHIFESFRQADSGTTRKYGGTGLGLAISKELTELMGGSLEVESVFGEGSVFRCEMQVEIPDEQPEPGDLPSGHALIAMQNPNAQRVIGRMLDRWGWSYVCASIDEASDSLSNTLADHPDALVIMDYRDLTGTDHLLDRCRDQGLHRMIFGTIEDMDLEIDESSIREAVLSYTLVPMELYSALQRLYSPEPAKPDNEAQPKKLSGHVLLAEDNPVNQEVARAMLEFLGMQVSIAGDGEIAVDMMEREAPDLILMDWHMPNLDGVAATRRIRDIERERGLAAVPIVMFTADTQKENRAVCMEAGVDDFLAKPVQMDALRSTLEQFRATTSA